MTFIVIYGTFKRRYPPHENFEGGGTFSKVPPTISDFNGTESLRKNPLAQGSPDFFHKLSVQTGQFLGVLVGPPCGIGHDAEMAEGKGAYPDEEDAEDRVDQEDEPGAEHDEDASAHIAVVDVTDAEDCGEESRQ